MGIRYFINQSFSWGFGKGGHLGDDRRKIPIPSGDKHTCTQT